MTESASQTTRASRIAKPSSSTSPSSSASSWGLSGRVGMRVLMHRDLITCRFFRSLPRSWLKKYWRGHGKESNKHPLASSSSLSSSFSSSSLSSSPLSWSSSPSSLSSAHFSSCSSSVPSHFLHSPVSRLFSPALKDRDREREHSVTASSQFLDGYPSVLSAPGMTISPRGPNTQLTAAHTTNTTAASAHGLGHSLHHHSSSGSVSLPCKLHLS